MYKLIVLSVVLVAASAQVVVPAGYGYAGPVHAAHAPLPYAGHLRPVATGSLAPAGILPHNVPAVNVIGRIEGAPEAGTYALPLPYEVAEAPLVSQTVEKVEQHG